MSGHAGILSSTVGVGCNDQVIIVWGLSDDSSVQLSGSIHNNRGTARGLLRKILGPSCGGGGLRSKEALVITHTTVRYS